MIIIEGDGFNIFWVGFDVLWLQYVSEVVFSQNNIYQSNIQNNTSVYF